MIGIKKESTKLFLGRNSLGLSGVNNAVFYFGGYGRNFWNGELERSKC